MALEVSPALGEEVAFRAIYLGGPPKAEGGFRLYNRGRERADDPQAPNFAIVCYNGKVRIEVVSDSEAEPLLPLIPKPAPPPARLDVQQPQSQVGSEGYEGYREEASEQGAEEKWESEESQLNRLRGFWGYLKRHLATKGGIRRERLPLYLAEQVWRYNHRALSPEQQVRLLMRLLRKGLRSGG